MKTGKNKKLTVVAESKNLLKVRDFVAKYSAKMGLLPRQVSEVKLAVDEAVSNIIRHAYVGSRGNVEIEIKRLESAVELKVMDKGVEFDWNSVLEPDLYRYVETRRKGGLGIWLKYNLIHELLNEPYPEATFAACFDITVQIGLQNRVPVKLDTLIHNL